MTSIDKIKNTKNKQLQKQIADFKKFFKDGTKFQSIVNGKVEAEIIIGETNEKEKQPSAKKKGEKTNKHTAKTVELEEQANKGDNDDNKNK